jgi:hypothetical protein
VARKKVAPGGINPLSPRKKWRAITLATLVFAPASWFILTGLVAGSVGDERGPNAAAAVVLGLVLIPFVFIVLAFLSEHPRAPGAVVRAMLLCVLVGVLVSAGATDGITGLVAGVGAGGIVALRNDGTDWRPRALAVILVAVWTLVLVRMVGAVALLPAPAMPLTAIGIADHLSERRALKASA